MNTSQVSTVRTLGRRNINLNAISMDDISLADIAHSLSMQCRFNGHVPHFFSVAEHSILVANRLPEEYQRWGLLHDAAEAYVGDLISPIKREISSYKELEESILKVIAEKFNLSWPMPEIVHLADHAQIQAEMCSHRGCWSDAPQDLAFLAPPIAKAEFLAKAHELGLTPVGTINRMVA